VRSVPNRRGQKCGGMAELWAAENFVVCVCVCVCVCVGGGEGGGTAEQSVHILILSAAEVTGSDASTTSIR
jgi:hypothetical protein